MEEEDWSLQPIADFVFLLVRKNDTRNILHKRFKKDQPALAELYNVIARIDEFGYEEGLEFAFAHDYMDTVRASGNMCLVEIRVKRTLWRVITYHAEDRKKLVMLDAFKAHEHKTMEDMVKQVKAKRDIAIRLIKEID